jgi:hypothetical protein
VIISTTPSKLSRLTTALNARCFSYTSNHRFRTFGLSRHLSKLACNCLILSVLFFGGNYSLSASPSGDLFTPPLFDTRLTHDGGAPCGMVSYSSPMLVDLDGDGSQEIIVATLKNTSDAGNYEPCLAVLNSNGSIRWSRVVPGSVNSTPAVGDINGDGQPDIVVGMGAENEPPTTGGVIAFDRNGNQLWYYRTGDIIGGGPGNGQPNGLPDGVWSSPSIINVNGDSSRQVVTGAWDQKIHLISGATGTPFPAPVSNPWPAQMLDTIWSSTAVADLNGDGQPDFVFGGDMDANSILCTTNGGLLRAMENLPGVGPSHAHGFDVTYGCPSGPLSPTYIAQFGRYVEQSIYSSPAIGDFGSRGLYIIAGSGCAFPAGTNCGHDGYGKWVKVWDHSGNLVATLATDAPVMGSPALADINGDGVLDIIVGSMGLGWVDGSGEGGTLYAWSGAPGFPLLWSRKPKSFFGLANVRIPSSPVAADLNGDGYPEIAIGYVGEIAVFDHNGNQLTQTNGTVRANIPTLWLGRSTVNNSPAIGDINHDGTLDIVAAGSYCGTSPNICDNVGHVRAWSASVLGLLIPPAAGRAAQSRLDWPMFRGDPTHQAYVVMHPILAPLSPLAMTFLAETGSNPRYSPNVTVRNISPLGMSYSLAYSQNVSGPASGTLGPNASAMIPLTVNGSGLGPGTYNWQVTLRADAGVVNGSQVVSIRLVVTNLKRLFLPSIRR